jgi:hypothetical protein
MSVVSHRRSLVPSRRLALGGAVLLLSAVAPASALAAPTVASSVPCVRYIGTNPPAPTLGVSASGWSALTPLTFTLGSASLGTGTTDATGAFSTGGSPFTPPEPKGNLQTMTLTAADATGAQATAKVRVVRLIVTVPGGKHKPSARVKYRAFGFAPGKKLYLFVRRGNKTKGRFTLGKPHGDCGLLTAKMRFMPLKRYSAGVYEFWFSHSKVYSRATRIYSYKIAITRS